MEIKISFLCHLERSNPNSHVVLKISGGYKEKVQILGGSFYILSFLYNSALCTAFFSSAFDLLLIHYMFS